MSEAVTVIAIALAAVCVFTGTYTSLGYLRRRAEKAGRGVDPFTLTCDIAASTVTVRVENTGRYPAEFMFVVRAASQGRIFEPRGAWHGDGSGRLNPGEVATFSREFLGAEPIEEVRVRTSGPSSDVALRAVRGGTRSRA